MNQETFNKRLQSDSQTCHSFCEKTGKPAPALPAVEAGVMFQGGTNDIL
tara:strand:+ start:4567 stop:4713 length:147 start_codon:yes stop_codon:yes gene_type:complete